MYKKGDIRIEYLTYDSREDDSDDVSYKYYEKKIISLPHSCNDWVIGGVEEGQIMLNDLQNAIKVLIATSGGKE